MAEDIGVSTAPPQWLIWQICYPEGLRLDKLKKDYWAANRPFDNQRDRQFLNRVHGCNGGYNPCERFSHNTGWSAPETKFEVPKGNLNSNAYAFYKGTRSADSGYSRCRFCQDVIWGEAGRKSHKDVQTAGLSHPRLIQKIAHLCAVRGECLACGSKTTERRWGVPLCKRNSCVWNWLFEEGWAICRQWREAKSAVMDDLKLPLEKRILTV